MPSADIAMDGVYAENAGAFFGLLLNHCPGYPVQRYRFPSGSLSFVDGIKGAKALINQSLTGFLPIARSADPGMPYHPR